MTSWKAQRNPNKGSVLIEGVLVAFLLSLTVLLNLEWLRRGYYEVMLEHAAFIRARDKVMGVSLERSRQKICRLFEQSMSREGKKICEKLKIKDRSGSSYGIRGVVAEVKLEYALFIPVEVDSSFTKQPVIQKNFEVTRRCPYPTSSY